MAGLTIKVTTLKCEKLKCGGREARWKFELSDTAPCDGYMVQQVDRFQDIEKCPPEGKAPALPTTPKPTFWEAWYIKKGDKVSEDTVTDGYTDGSRFAEHDSERGIDVVKGTIKFFCKKTTGDLGNLNKKPSDPNSKWGPGKVPTSGSLPSTDEKPSWWDDTPEAGPAERKATSDWVCCTDVQPKNDVTCEPK